MCFPSVYVSCKRNPHPQHAVDETRFSEAMIEREIFFGESHRKFSQVCMLYAVCVSCR